MSTPADITPSKTASHYLALAKAWDEQGRPPALLPEHLSLVALFCWELHETRRGASPGPQLRAFVAAAMAAQPEGWYDGILAKRGHCAHCGDTFRVENLSVCTRCAVTVCPSCCNHLPRAANNLRQCDCGGEMAG